MKNRVRVSHVFVWQTVFIFCRIAHSLARPMGGVCASPGARFAAAKPLGGVCRAAIPAHTTSFGHISLKSRWPLSSRSSSPPGTCRSPIPPDGARGARAARGLAPRSHRTAFCHIARVDGVSPARGASSRATGMTALGASATISADRRSPDAPCARDAPVPRPRD